jgi:hypothetical protein
MEPWHLFGHFLLALAISSFIYLKTKKLKYVLVCFLASFLIDIDHFFDFWMAHGFSLDLKKFFEIDYFFINKKVYVPFHSWELVGLTILLSTVIKRHKWFLLSIGLAMLGHILWDAFSYGIFLEDYSFFHRAENGFRVKCWN